MSVSLNTDYSGLILIRQAILNRLGNSTYIMTLNLPILKPNFILLAEFHIKYSLICEQFHTNDTTAFKVPSLAEIGRAFPEDAG